MPPNKYDKEFIKCDSNYLQYKSLQRTRNLTNGHLKFQACFFQESIYEECAIGRMNEWNTSLGYIEMNDE